MKNVILLLYVSASLLVFGSSIYAQNSESKWGVGLYGGTNQYVGDLGSDLFQLPYYGYGGLSVARYINPSFDLGFSFTYGDYGHWEDTYYNFLTRKFDGSLDLYYKFNNGYILEEDASLSPYLVLGVGLANYQNSRGFESTNNDLVIPVGVGVTYSVNNWLAFRYQFLYNFTNSDTRDVLVMTQEGINDGYFQQSIGIVFSFGKMKDSDRDGISDKLDKCPETPKEVNVGVDGCPLDKDSDGIADYLDKCPDVKGLSNLDGCPDKDGDGIKDSEDKCPDVKGIAQFDGCPDTDGDGVKDSEDNCPTEIGLAKFNGCPDTDGDGIMDKEDQCPKDKGLLSLQGCPDSDSDGIADKDDKCPNVAGVAINKGCPEIKEETIKVFQEALEGIKFETGSNVIKASSFAILNQVVKVMKDNLQYNLMINGHTDNVGDPKMNLDLSDRRAKSVEKYLIDNGVDESRMEAKGFGDTKPVEDNGTVAGRAHNRRVEFKILF